VEDKIIPGCLPTLEEVEVEAKAHRLGTHLGMVSMGIAGLQTITVSVTQA